MLEKLTTQIEGEVLSDPTSLMMYATDASIYQQRPKAVVIPKSIDDCRGILQFANEHGLGIIPRAGGTSLAGQVVGKHLVIDTSQYLNRIVNVDVDRQIATIEPGVIPEHLNHHLQNTNLMFAPDPSTLDRCTIGGMIGNNAWGAHCLVYGTTADNVLSMEGILPNGDTIQYHPMSIKQFKDKFSTQNTEAIIYKTIDSIITNNKKLILNHYPKLSEVPCNTGYALHKLAAMRPWADSGDDFNLSPLICGSEGTLSFVSHASVKLVTRPKYKTMICAHFNDLQQALKSVPHIKLFSPGAIELLDNYLLKLVHANETQQNNIKWLSGNPEAILLIEFFSHEKQLLEKTVRGCLSMLKGSDFGYHFPTLEQQQTQKAWQVRRAALGLLMGVVAVRKPVTFIEDSAVPVNKLAEFVSEVKQLMKNNNVHCVYYGSVSMGLIHLRPLLDLHQSKDIELLNHLLDKTATLLKSYKGSLSAKHGDGIIRGQHITTMLGDDISSLFKEIKSVFDPNGIMNPGKIVDPLPIDKNLRYQPNNNTTINNRKGINTYFKWDKDKGFINSIEKCNGSGVCRKTTEIGTMCPSYRASGNEFDSTRARANIFRQTYLNQTNRQALDKKSLTKVLTNCLSCKACKSECPANVDMAKMKSEHQYQHLKSHGKSPVHYLLKNYESLSKISCIIPTLSNKIMQTNFLKNTFNIHPSRTLPTVHHFHLGRWFKRHLPHNNTGTHGSIILFSDPFSYYYDVEAGVAAIEVLERFGYQVILTPCFPSVRTMISHGLLDEIIPRLKTITSWFSRCDEKNIPIVGLEPSEILSYRDELLDLNINTNLSRQIKNISGNLILFEEFISNNNNPTDINWKQKAKNIVVHNHCHQKSLTVINHTEKALSIIPNSDIKTLKTGCCGMAGLFGYSKQTYELSMQISELALFPQIRSIKDSIIVATGTSCRQQIKHGMNRKAYSTAEVIRQSIIN